eukprot:COSAG06_NODE_74595_length_140_cov_5833.219512_1_plen_23_part_01
MKSLNKRGGHLQRRETKKQKEEQ